MSSAAFKSIPLNTQDGFDETVESGVEKESLKGQVLQLKVTQLENAPSVPSSVYSRIQSLGFMGASLIFHLLLGAGFYFLDSLSLSSKVFETQKDSVLAWIQIEEPVLKSEPAVKVQEPVRRKPVQRKQISKKVVRKINQPKKVEPKTATVEPTVLAAKDRGDASFKVDAKPAENIATKPSAVVSKGIPASPKVSNGNEPSVDIRGMTRDWVSSIGSMIRRNALRDYPLRARKMGIEGTVVLTFWMDASGKIKEIRVKKSSGHNVLDNAALASLSNLNRLPSPPSEIQWKSRRPISMPITYRMY